MPNSKSHRRRGNTTGTYGKMVSRTQPIGSKSDARVVQAMLNNVPSQVSETITRVCNSAASFTSNGSGVLNGLVNLVPNSSNWTNWNNLYPLYDEFRVIGAKIEILPATGVINSTSQWMIVMVYDNDDGSTALVSQPAACDYRVKKIFPTNWVTPNPVTLSVTCWSVNGSPGSGTAWSTCVANPTAYPRSFKLYGSTLTASTTYFYANVELVLQLRGAT